MKLIVDSGSTKADWRIISLSNHRIRDMALGSVNTDMLKSAFPEFASPTSTESISKYLSNFVLEGNRVVNGLTQVVSVSNP